MLQVSLILAVNLFTSASVFAVNLGSSADKTAIAQVSQSIESNSLVQVTESRSLAVTPLRASFHQHVLQLAQTILSPDVKASRVKDGFEVAMAYLPSFDTSIMPPSHWQVATVAPGVSIYAPPIEEVISWNPFDGSQIQDSQAQDSQAQDSQAQDSQVELDQIQLDQINGIDQDGFDVIDGTRHPYVLYLGLDTLMQHSVGQGQYQISATWQGEGYDRERDRHNTLISQRELGDDIHITVFYDASIKHKTQPNLIITLENEQQLTGQYTNISAFWMDAETGEAIARRDFEQLPPTYSVTLSKNGGFAGTETKQLLPGSRTIFAEHVTSSELPHVFPLKLQADNQLFEERQGVLQELRSQGWLIKEVPPPSR
jgi:hypothetical protein